MAGVDGGDAEPAAGHPDSVGLGAPLLEDLFVSSLVPGAERGVAWPFEFAFAASFVPALSLSEGADDAAS
eukprot:4703589-Pyramimonas_sp.AAC.1